MQYDVYVFCLIIDDNNNDNNNNNNNNNNTIPLSFESIGSKATIFLKELGYRTLDIRNEQPYMKTAYLFLLALVRNFERFI